jgi:hypothetical protein
MYAPANSSNIFIFSSLQIRKFREIDFFLNWIPLVELQGSGTWIISENENGRIYSYSHQNPNELI